MSYRMKLGVLFAALALTGTALAQVPAKVTRIRGEIVSRSGSTLTVHRNSGDNAVIALAPDVSLAAVKKIKLSDIKPGSFVGTTAMTGGDGKRTATEVHVFPESARGTGEGHYAWDLGPNSTMTNANVDSVVEGTSGRDLKLSYKGGNNVVTVPQNVPIVTFAPASRTDLTPGKKGFVGGRPAARGTF